jgi:EAL domain-containing protein (putative c-di-GMP-specific phosphodiesterase class I)
VSYLKDKGFVIAMDDFGSGYSNLLRLSKTPFDIIKLDLKLLERIPNDIWATSFYREIVNLCSSTGCMIVSEGVETQIQSDFVRWAGVDLIQGFLYATPKKLLLLSTTTDL